MSRRYTCDECDNEYIPKDKWSIHNIDIVVGNPTVASGALRISISVCKDYKGQEMDVCPNCIRKLALRALKAEPKRKRTLELDLAFPLADGATLLQNRSFRAAPVYIACPITHGTYSRPTCWAD